MLHSLGSKARVTLLSLLASGALLAQSPAQAQEKITWRVPTAVPEGSFFYDNFLKRFAANVEVMTGGQLEIKPFGAGVIVPAFKIYEAVLDGTVEAGHSTPSFLVNQDPTNAIYAGFPGGMGSETFVHWMYEGGGLARFQEFRSAQGLHTLVVGIGTSEVLAHANKPIRSTADLASLKYRTSGAWAAVLKDAFQGVPTVVPPGEIFTLLQRKGVDAVEWATPGSNLSEGFHKIAKYVVMPGIHQPTFMWEVVIKTDTWNSLPDALKPKVEAAAKLTTLESRLHFGAADIKGVEEYRKAGNEIIQLDAGTIDEIRVAGQGWAKARAVEQKEKGSDVMQTTLDDYLKFQRDWAENSFYLVRDEK